MKPSENFAVAFLKEQERLRQCLEQGRSMGPACSFYCAVVESVLHRAEHAVATCDVSAMVRSYAEMQEIQE